jgi:ABC-2 type transport system ATP-binding protein
VDGTRAAGDERLRIDDVHRSFGDVRALAGVSLSAGRGEVVGLLGHNGAGKTTAVRLLTGILAPDAGTVRVHGLDPVVDGVEVRRRLGVVHATPSVDDRLTAQQNLAFVGAVQGVPADEVDARSVRLLAQLGLAERARERVGGFSSGMRQRLAVARALLHEPPVLLLDEPTAALDPVASRQLRQLLGELARDGGRTVVLCTHNLVEAQELCDRVLVLERGQVLADGAPNALAARLQLDCLRLEVQPRAAGVAARVAAGLGGEVDVVGGGALRVRGVARDGVPALLAALVRSDVQVYAVEPEAASLEDVYFALHERGVA